MMGVVWWWGPRWVGGVSRPGGAPQDPQPFPVEAGEPLGPAGNAVSEIQNRDADRSRGDGKPNSEVVTFYS